jgi:hypothetical protein
MTRIRKHLPFQLQSVAKVGFRAAVAMMATSLAVGLGAAQVAGQTAPNNLFTASGFTVRYADTPEKRALLDRLPADKLVMRKRGGKTYYIYADPNICRCAYVGSPEAYRVFQNGGMQQTSDGSSGDQFVDEFAEADMPAQPGAPSFDDYVFGGMRDD